MKVSNNSGLKLFFLILLCIVPLITLTAAPSAILWEKWLANDPESTRFPDHSLWNEFLESYVITDDPSGVNLVRYADVTPADRRSLDMYISQLEAENVDTLNRNEQLAFWLNLYNALTVRVILEHYPVKSIRDVDISGFFRNGPWDAHLVRIMGEKLTLNDIEHRIIRPIWPGPLAHYVVNCASYSCPELEGEAFTGENVWDYMKAGAREYVNHPRGVKIEGNVMHLSSIYKWYMDEDFGGDRDGLIEHLFKYAEAGLANEIRNFRGRLSFNYVWTLNEPVSER
ncbi:MAG: DUF547 domain-containing protein [Spirochaetales bacterium]|uniref:DUF547 domain-containing protein n=1 Tax=Candidatus Thalassospirochaeta sargassi TaxID=3119039 RepID=A0AAJ1MN44_9SPIO|nr:DUF547 domain-containing protein [Spirochaetales bacterium]